MQEAVDEAQREIERRGGLKCVEPNIICLDGHRFYINYEVPQHITDQLNALFEQDEEVKYEDIPEEVKAYEEKEEQSGSQETARK